MKPSRTIVDIRCRDFWFKVVDFLQQNWAIIDADSDGEKCTVYFFSDTSGVFDRLRFDNEADAAEALRRNGFSRFEEDSEAQSFIGKPTPPFYESSHPNGPIYSSGRFWC